MLADDRIRLCAEAVARRAWAARCAPSAPLVSALVKDEAEEHRISEVDLPAIYELSIEMLLQRIGRGDATAA